MSASIQVASLNLDIYVGLPFLEHGRSHLGCDCYGLLRLVYQEQLGIMLPSYTTHYITTQDADHISRLIAGELSPWHEVFIERPLDAVLLREGSAIRHVGVVASPGKLLHVEDGSEAVIEPYKTGRLKRRVVGFYRHECNLP